MRSPHYLEYFYRQLLSPPFFKLKPQVELFKVSSEMRVAL
jgi:hypothetical protein